MSQATRAHSVPVSQATYATHRGMLYRVRFWSEQEWEALPDACRPKLAEYIPGLCWVGAIPVEHLN